VVGNAVVEPWTKVVRSSRESEPCRFSCIGLELLEGNFAAQLAVIGIRRGRSPGTVFVACAYPGGLICAILEAAVRNARREGAGGGNVG